MGENHDYRKTDDYRAFLVDDQGVAEETQQEVFTISIPLMLEFYGERIAEMRMTAKVLKRSPLTEALGLFVEGDADAHDHIREWASRVLDTPRPEEAKDKINFLYWETCMRVLRRHVAAWKSHPDYLAIWSPDEHDSVFTPAEEQEKEVRES